MRVLARRAAAVAILALLSACGRPDAESAPPAAEPAGATRYTDAAGRFSLALPQDWQTLPDYQGTAVTSFGQAAAEDGMRPVINVTTERLDPPVALEEYAQQSRARLEAAFYGLEVSDSGDGTLGGEPARWLLVNYTVEGQAVTALMTYAVVGSQAYAVTALAEPEHFRELAPRFKELVGSFRFPAADAR